MAVKMMRRNVLVEVGMPVGRYKTFLEQPQDWHRVNSKGKVLDVAPDCRLVDQSIIGKNVLIGVVKGDEYRLRPKGAKSIGLNEFFHFICPESKIIAILED